MASSFFSKSTTDDATTRSSNTAVGGFRSRKPGHDSVLHGSSTRLGSSNSNTTLAKKKLVIKPFKVAPTLPPAFEAETWRKLETAIDAVHRKQPTTFSREELYRSVEDMCTWKMAASLYQKLEATCTAFIATRVQQLHSVTGDTSLFLDAVHTMWDDHCDDLQVLRTIFLFLDRTYVMQTPQIASIWDMGLHVLRNNIVAHQPLQTKIIAGLLELIQRERTGETINRSLVYNLLRMLLALELYHNDFEPRFLTASEQFYAAEGASMVDSSSVADFLQHVDTRLREEHTRCVHYIDASTRKHVIRVVETQLLQPHVATLLSRGFAAMMDAVRIPDLHRMYALFARVDAIEQLKQAFTQYIRTKVSTIILDIAQEKVLVEKLLSFKSDLDRVLADAFVANPDFVFALKGAMEYAINVRASRPAELVAKFVDAKLRIGNKGGSSELEVEQLLDHVMVLFRYIHGKDVFEAFYKKDLAKRLLVGKSASFDLEKLMLAKLKTECGSSFTNKLEGMFKDIELSSNVMTQFQQHAASRTALEALGPRAPDMQVQVLTTSFWPPYAAVDIHVPEALVPLKAIFDTFYASKYQGRQLQWQHSLAQCVVKATFGRQTKKELVVSLFQTVVLLCFNTIDTLGFKEILEQTRIEDGELRRTLQSLACGKVRVLQKSPKGKDIGDADVFHFNATFQNQLYRIKINSIQMKETKQENEETHERVFRDRQYQVDAAIVRIMKSRKQLAHGLLMAEIFTQIKFPAKATDVKRRIESLIDREYLERDAANAQVYNYLA